MNYSNFDFFEILIFWHFLEILIFGKSRWLKFKLMIWKKIHSKLIFETIEFYFWIIQIWNLFEILTGGEPGQWDAIIEARRFRPGRRDAWHVVYGLRHPHLRGTRNLAGERLRIKGKCNSGFRIIRNPSLKSPVRWFDPVLNQISQLIYYCHLTKFSNINRKIEFVLNYSNLESFWNFDILTFFKNWFFENFIDWNSNSWFLEN